MKAMLLHLNIKNFVLIDELSLDFAGGFSALTGETGAGKSIVLTALSLITGQKADASLIRFGEKQASVSASFDVNAPIKALLDENGIEADELIIRRTISPDGKSKAFVNDSAVSLKLLQQLGEHLVEIHSQHEQSSLTDPAKQLDIIDDFAGVNLTQIAAVYEDLKNTRDALEAAKQRIELARKEEDYLRHVHEELQQFAPITGEEAELAEKRRAMMNHEKTYGIITRATEELTSGKNVEEAIFSAQKILLKTGLPQFTEVIDALERAGTEVSNAFGKLEEIAANDTYNPQVLENIEARLFSYREMARKFACQPDELAAHMDEVAAKLKSLKTEEQDLKALETKLNALQNEYNGLAEGISEKRQQAAGKMEHKLVGELKPLAMASTRFEVAFTKTQGNATGWDKVVFTASTNPGMPLKSLADVASGGEISRFMLALKVVLLGTSGCQTIIFDEIDTGTGGAVAASIGERLARLGKNLQVFVVTHLPQVAALAQNHLKVSKKTVKGKNLTSVSALSPEERKEELARMLAGSSITDEARAAAEKLLG